MPVIPITGFISSVSQCCPNTKVIALSAEHVDINCYALIGTGLAGYIDRTTDDILIGKLVDVLILEANDVYVINKEDGEELLVPALKSVVRSFDAKNKIMVLNQKSILFEDDED